MTSTPSHSACPEQQRRARSTLGTLALFAAGASFLFIAAFLMMGHAFIFHHMEEALPAAARIPALEARLSILKEQVDVSALHASLDSGSAGENIRVFVLPEGESHDRLLSYFEMIREELTKKKMLRAFSAVEFGPREAGEHALFAQPLSFSIEGTEEGVQQFFALLNLSGIVTLGDALTKDEQYALMQKTEEANPAGIVLLGQFLGADFLDYLRDPRTFEDRLRKFFSSEDFTATLQSIHQSPFFQEGQKLFQSPLGKALDQNHLWPVQFLELRESALEELSDGWYRLSVTLSAYSR